MLRRLYIIRHAKSSWDHHGLEDIDRPLASRGIRNAKDMAGRLLKAGLIPQVLFTSPANRALNTALLMSSKWKLDPEQLQVHELLYDAYVSDIQKVVSRAPSHISDLAIYGHNPAFTAYANIFLDFQLDNLPTAGVVVVSLESDSWEDIGSHHVKETHLDYPKRK